MKLTADRDGAVRFFSAKLGWRERFDPRELEMLFAGAVPRLIAPAVVQGKKNNVLKYNISEFSTLEFQLTCVMSREQFADLLLQCIQIFREMQQVYLGYKNLVFDLDKIYMQMERRTVHFIYLPLLESRRSASLPDFFRRMIQKASRSTYEQVSFLDACLAYLSRPIPFALEEFDAFLQGQLDGQSAPLAAVPLPQPVYAAPAPPRSERVYRPVPVSPVPAAAPAALATPPAPAAPVMAVPSGEPVPAAPAASVISPPPAPVQGATGRLDTAAGGGTVLLCEPEPPRPVLRFYLIREQTGEKIPVTHTPFLVGTEAGSVSYCVIGNAAVSRRHMELSIVDGQCCITDQKSTNKTYVNDCAIVPMVPQPLQDGDHIRLGNERFTFVREE